MMRPLLPALLVSLILLAACGFSPVYGTHDGGETSAALSQIAISNIADREGQQLRNHLIDRMYRNGRPQNPIAQLDITLQLIENELGLRKDATASRVDLYVTATYVLSDQSHKELMHGTARSIVSYNKLDAQYGTLASRQNAGDRAINEIGEQIVNRLSVYFAEHEHPAPNAETKTESAPDKTEIKSETKAETEAPKTEPAAPATPATPETPAAPTVSAPAPSPESRPDSSKGTIAPLEDD